MNKIKNKPKFSRAIMEIAKNNLKEFKRLSDEGFIIRAELNRRLSMY